MTKEANLEAVNSVLSKEVRKLQEELKAADKTNMAFTARVAELEAALRPLACTCEAESQDECSRSEKHCPFWNARAALTKGESNDH